MGDTSLENDGIVKTLLMSTTLLSLPSRISTTALMSRPAIQYTAPPCNVRQRSVEESISKIHNYFSQYTNTNDRDKGSVTLDHSYARPYNWTPESAFFQPTKTLFMPAITSSKGKSKNPLTPSTSQIPDDIDVEITAPDLPELYDKVKANNLMNECEKHAMFGKNNQEDDNWEDSISRINWTAVQNMVFTRMANILHNDRLARLANTHVHHEPILRRTSIDKSVKRVRQLFATISWDCHITQWLHQLLIDNLSTLYLGAYLDILQGLKAKLPTFVDKMMFGPNSNARVGITSNESLFNLLKRPWDPFASNLSQNRPRKLPGNPIIIIVPSAPAVSNSSQFKRQHKWNSLLANLATVIVVNTNIGNSASRMSMTNCADQMLAITRAKLIEVKSEFPGRPILLVGYNAGAALALQVAQVEHVVCVVCLGFSVLTAEGKRGDPDDNLLELQCPVLFVIGQCSNTSLREDMEDLRERMRVENGLIVVGSADDYLRIDKRTKRAEGITQNAVDRIIVENVGEFLSGLLLSPFPPQLRQSPTFVSSEVGRLKRVKVERKRNNSNGSSIDSEPPSPTPKITRPVGRPPGSKTKAKWAAQTAQGIPSPSNSPPPPPPPLTHTPNTPTLSTSPLQNRPAGEKIPSHNLSNGDHETMIFSDASATLDGSPSKTASSAKADMHALGLSRSLLTSGNHTLSNLLQSGCRQPPSLNVGHNSKQTGIKVLEHMTLNPNSTAKLISSTTGRCIDLSKITVLNSINTAAKQGASVGNVLLLPDGKVKPIKNANSAPLLLPTMNKNNNKPPSVPGSTHRVAKYITSKKQLIGRKPPYPIQKQSVLQSYSPHYPAPTNLTSQDIMDLPIIFADDNQILTDNSKLQQSDISMTELVQPASKLSLAVSNPVGKFVFINKQVPPLQSPSISNLPQGLKRPAAPLRSNPTPVKYTKIIISRASTAEQKPAICNNSSTQIASLSSEISIKKIGPPSAPIDACMEAIDLENAIAASTIPNPRIKQEMEGCDRVTSFNNMQSEESTNERK